MSTGCFTCKKFVHASLLPAAAILFLLAGPVSGQVDYDAINPFGGAAEQPEANPLDGIAGEGGGEAEAPQQADPNQINEEAQKLMEEGEFGAAVAKLAQVITLSPNYAPAYLDLSLIHI